MISPENAKALDSNSTKRSITDIVKDIDREIARVHGWYPWEEAILDYELSVAMRNRIANMYIKAGWRYVYHHTSSENLEAPGLTVFRFSMEDLDKKYVRGMYKLSAPEG